MSDLESLITEATSLGYLVTLRQYLDTTRWYAAVHHHPSRNTAKATATSPTTALATALARMSTIDCIDPNEAWLSDFPSSEPAAPINLLALLNLTPAQPAERVVINRRI